MFLNKSHVGSRKSDSMMVDDINMSDAGIAMYDMARHLFPICRSITGNGVRETLSIINNSIPLQIHEIPSGTQVFDWTIPKEWNIRDAYIKDPEGRKIVDFRRNNLHVVNYSMPLHATMSLHELRKHLHTLPDRPDWIPYRTSYYNESWGFCLSEKLLNTLQDGDYEVFIDSSLDIGHLTYAEFVIKGETSDEVLLTTHICHPSLANDNLSGIVVLTHLASILGLKNRRYTYRLLWIPGTIGSIAWLALNQEGYSRIKHGLVMTCLGDNGGPTFKRSRRENSKINRVMEHVLCMNYSDAVIEEFYPYGYDERQFCSPGIDLPVGLIQRSKHGQYPEYHTSADNLNFIAPEHLAESLRLIVLALDILENDAVYFNKLPYCEPQLGKRNLYDTIGGDKDRAARQLALLWVLNMSDGEHSLLDIAIRSKIPFNEIFSVAIKLEQSGLLQREYSS